MNQFFEFENDLVERTVKAFQYWHYVRWSLFNAIKNAQGSMNENTGQSYNKQNWFWTLLKLTVKTQPIFAKKATVLVLSHYRHVLNKSGRHECMYTAAILRHLKEPYAVLEPVYQQTDWGDTQPEIQSIYTNAQVAFCISVVLNLYKLIGYVDKTIEKEACFLQQKIEQSYHLDVAIGKIYDQLQYVYLIHKFGKCYFRRVLKRIQPKVVVAVVGYNPYNMLITECAKELGIQVLELQHGIIGSEHVTYNYSRKMMLKTFPDKILTYSEYWNGNARYPIALENVIAVGLPYLEEKVKQTKKKKQDDICEILFISQWSIGKQLSEFAVDLYNYLVKNSVGTFKIVYKLHPEEKIEDNPQYVQLYQYRDKIEIVGRGGADLYQCFATADIQVGCYSTGLYEGLAYGLETYIFNTHGSERVMDLVDGNYARLVSTSEELWNYRNNPNDFCEMKTFWKENALENILVEIQKVIDDEAK